MILLFLKSVLLGAAVAAPLGPVGMMCVTRTITRGFWFGFAGGAGIALADGFYAAVAAVGFAALAGFLDDVNLSVSMIGGVVIILIGLKIMRDKPRASGVHITAGSLAGSTASAFALTILNPVTMLSFVAIFAGLGLGGEMDLQKGGTVVGGVFLGSLAWWFLLCGGMSLVRRRLPQHFALWVSRVSGVLIVAFGAGAIINALIQWH